MTSPHTFVSLRRDSVSVLLDATGGRLPALLHWGADLGPLHLDDARALGLRLGAEVQAEAGDQKIDL